MERVHVDMISTGRITIMADAVGYNPNALGGTLERTNIQVYANDLPVATIVQDLGAPLDPQADFRIPLQFDTSPRALFQDEAGGLLQGIVNAVVDRQVDLRYEGTLIVTMAGLEWEVPVAYEETVAIK
jgi:hypothetical protein